jgi:hypothetical protein
MISLVAMENKKGGPRGTRQKNFKIWTQWISGIRSKNCRSSHFLYLPILVIDFAIGSDKSRLR